MSKWQRLNKVIPNHRAYRVCINKADMKKFLTASLWPNDITISSWYSKKNGLEGQHIQQHRCAQLNSCGGYMLGHNRHSADTEPQNSEERHGTEVIGMESHFQKLQRLRLLQQQRTEWKAWSRLFMKSIWIKH